MVMEKINFIHYTLFWLDLSPIVTGKTEGMVFHFLNRYNPFNLFNNLIYKIRLGAAK